ncbi:MAG: glycosyltransferase family 9 protein [Nitrospinales bacterium]
MPPSKASANKPGKILLIKLGAVGDLVLASAFFDALRKHYAEAEICLLTGKSSCQTVKNNPCIDRLILADDTVIYRGKLFSRIHETARILRLLRKERFDMVYVLHRAWPFNALAFLSGIPRRIGFARDMEGIMLTERTAPQPSRNERETYLDLLRAVGIAAVYEKSFYFISEEEDRFAAGFLARNNLGEEDGLIAIAPGGGKNVKTFMPQKRWPKENFIGLIQKISEKLPCRVILFGSPGERGLISDILAENPQCVDASNLSFGEMASVFRKCALFIGNDTGSLHIAAAMGLPTLSFYGPTDPREWAPPGPEDTALYKKVECSPCYDQGRFPECHHLKCLYSITVEEARRQVVAKLAKTSKGV